MWSLYIYIITQIPVVPTDPALLVPAFILFLNLIHFLKTMTFPFEKKIRAWRSVLDVTLGCSFRAQRCRENIKYLREGDLSAPTILSSVPSRRRVCLPCHGHNESKIIYDGIRWRYDARDQPPSCSSSASPSFPSPSADSRVKKKKERKREPAAERVSFFSPGFPGCVGGRRKGKYMIYGDSGIVRRNAKKSPGAVERLNFSHPLCEYLRKRRGGAREEGFKRETDNAREPLPHHKLLAAAVTCCRCNSLRFVAINSRKRLLTARERETCTKYICDFRCVCRAQRREPAGGCLRRWPAASGLDASEDRRARALGRATLWHLQDIAGQQRLRLEDPRQVGCNTARFAS